MMPSLNCQTTIESYTSHNRLTANSPDPFVVVKLEASLQLT